MFLVIFLLGCKEEEKTIYLVPEGPPEITTAVEKILKDNPQIVDSAIGDEFIVKIIPPDSSIDHKISIIRPDPDIDFKIGIINPYGNAQTSQMQKLSQKLAEEIRKKMQEQLDKP